MPVTVCESIPTLRDRKAAWGHCRARHRPTRHAGRWAYKQPRRFHHAYPATAPRSANACGSGRHVAPQTHPHRSARPHAARGSARQSHAGACLRAAGDNHDPPRRSAHRRYRSAHPSTQGSRFAGPASRRLDHRGGSRDLIADRRLGAVADARRRSVSSGKQNRHRSRSASHPGAAAAWRKRQVVPLCR